MFSIESLRYPSLQKSMQNSIDFIIKEHPLSLRRVILFGSCARGEETEKSDIDLCLVFDDSEEITSRELLMYKGYLRCIDEYDRDLVFCKQEHLLKQESLLYKLINREGRILLDFSNSEDNKDIFSSSESR